MAKVAVFCMYVWECPHCPTVSKAQTQKTLVASSEYHMLREHDTVFNEPSWDPVIDRRHWAFNVKPEPEVHPRPLIDVLA